MQRGLQQNRAGSVSKNFQRPAKNFSRLMKNFQRCGKKLSAGRRKTFSASEGETRLTSDHRMSRGRRRRRQQRFGQHEVDATACRAPLRPRHKVETARPDPLGAISGPLSTVSRRRFPPIMSWLRAPNMTVCSLVALAPGM